MSTWHKEKTVARAPKPKRMTIIGRVKSKSKEEVDSSHPYAPSKLSGDGTSPAAALENEDEVPELPQQPKRLTLARSLSRKVGFAGRDATVQFGAAAADDPLPSSKRESSARSSKRFSLFSGKPAEAKSARRSLFSSRQKSGGSGRFTSGRFKSGRISRISSPEDEDETSRLARLKAKAKRMLPGRRGAVTKKVGPAPPEDPDQLAPKPKVRTELDRNNWGSRGGEEWW